MSKFAPKLCTPRLDPRQAVLLPRSMARFVARECGVRVAPQPRGVLCYDYRENSRPQIFDPVHNPLGNVEAFDSAYPRILDGLRRDAKRREQEAKARAAGVV